MIIGYRSLLLAVTGLAFVKSSTTDDANCTGVNKPPKPVVIEEPKYFMKGEQFSLNCTVYLHRNSIVTLSWTFPKGLNMNDVIFQEDSNSGNITEGTLYKNITIYNASQKHEGNYSCVSRNSCEYKESKVVKKLLDHAFLNVALKGTSGLTRQIYSSTPFDVDSYPKATFTVLKNDKEIPIGAGKYSLVFKKFSNYEYVVFTVKPLDITDNANFTFVANNGKLEKRVTFKLEVGAAPEIAFGNGNKICVSGMNANVKCDVSGYPLPEISWVFSYNDTDVPMKSAKVIQTSNYNETAYLELKQCDRTGTITCKATNKIDSATASRELFVYELISGFGISTDSTNKILWALENEIVTLKCLASIYEFSNVTWLLNSDENSRETVEYPNSSEFSHVAELKIDHITLNHTGKYTCYGEKNNGSKVFDDIQINVFELQPPVIKDAADIIEDVYRYKTTQLNCIVEGAPLPQIEWYKDEKPVTKNHSNVELHYNNINLTAINSTIVIHGMQPENVGKYECVAVSRNTSQKKSFTLKLKGNL